MIIKIVNKQKRLWQQYEIYVDEMLTYTASERYWGIFKTICIYKISTAEKVMTIKRDFLLFNINYRMTTADGSKLLLKLVKLASYNYTCKSGGDVYIMDWQDEYNFDLFKNTVIKAKMRAAHKSIFSGADYLIAAEEGVDALLLSAICLTTYFARKHREPGNIKRFNPDFGWFDDI